MDTTQLTHISLCAGYGGIDLGLRRVLPSVRTIAYSEIEEFACALLASRMASGQIDVAPIWSNLKTFPWQEFHGLVDILSGGYPCQPFSSAGKRLGAEDPRHLWPFIADGVSRMQPRVVFFENVEGHISLGLREVIADLESRGYKATWGLFSAAECGAPHQRKRVFILAHRQSAGLEGYGRPQQGEVRNDPWPSRPGQPQFAWEPHRVLADPNRDGGRKGGQLCTGTNGHQPFGDGEARGVGNMGDTRMQEPRRLPNGAGWNKIPKTGQSSAGLGDAADPESPQRRPGAVQESQRSDGSSERQQTEPTVGGNSHGSSHRLDYAELHIASDSRIDELRLLGNGVVPATAALAFQTLAQELGL